MPSSAEELLVKIEATTESLRRELKRGEDAVAGFKTKVDRDLSQLNGVFTGLGGALRTALGAIGVGVGISAFVNLGRSALTLADNLDDTAGQLQVSTEYLQEMRYAAEQTGVETGALENAIAKLNGRIGDAVSGQKTAVGSFERVGVAFKNADGSARSVERVIADLADRIQSLPDPAQRAAAAAELLGEKAGPRLVALLSGGSVGLADWAGKAHEAFAVMSDAATKRLAAAEQAIKDFQKTLTIGAGETLNWLAELRDAYLNSDFVVGSDKARFEAIIGGLKSALDAEIEDLNKASDRLEQLSGERDPDETKLARAKRRVEAQRADVEAAVAALKQAQSEYEKYLNGINPGQLRDDRAPPGSLNSSTSTFTLGGDAPSGPDKFATALENLRFKLGQLQSDLDEDGFGKLLAQNFKDAGLALDDYSPKAEQVRVLTELQWEATQKLTIGEQGLTAARAADKEAGEEWNKVMQEAAALTESVRTPLEEYNATLARASYLRDLDLLSQENYNRIVDQAGDAFVSADEKSQMLIQSASQLGSGFVSAFSRIGQAGNDLDNVLQGLLQTLAQVLANLAGGGIESWIGDIIKAGLPAAGSALSADIDGMIAANPEIFRDGGIMTGRGRVPLRRYSAGGVARTPQVAYFAEGGVPEAYVPVPSGRIPVEMRGGGKGGDTFNITNNIQVSGGTREQNRDAAERSARAVERQMNDFVDRRLLYHQQPGGMTWQHVVS